jgi:ubiquinone/menaquinone biosynthesis C-methylase UbiE
MKFSFELPALSSESSSPIWTGQNFKIGDQSTKLLEYSSDLNGWSDGLTSFHEDTAGDNHFIDRASREHALQQIQKYASGDSPTILEIGCSSGFLIKDIYQRFPKANIIGADVVRDALLKLADEMPHVPFLRFDLVNCPLPDNSIDIVIMLNVLEHIEHDEAAIKQVYRILKPGGVLILEVPAGPQLYDAYDKVLMHYRRYSSQMLNALVLK